MTVSGYANMGEFVNIPNGKLAEVLQFKDNLTWIRGRHAFKFGGQFEWVRSYFFLGNSARGNFAFSGAFTQDPLNRTKTGNGFADFLLGIPSTASLSNTAIGDVRQLYIAGFAQDDWKVTSRLTVNLGLRNEVWTPCAERNNLQANFVPSLNKLIYPENKTPAGIPQTAVTTIPDGVGSRSLVRSYDLDFAPRVGIAYQLTKSTVIRTGAGSSLGHPISRASAQRRPATRRS